jgi:hypothetical protein
MVRFKFIHFSMLIIFIKIFYYNIGTNKKSGIRLLKRIGGKTIFDPHHHTLFLECQIPTEVVHKDAIKINFLLGK